MADPIEEIASKLNGLGTLPTVYADVARQGAQVPYIVVSRLNPTIERAFGGTVFQFCDFQVKQYNVDYSEETVTAAKADHDTIETALELQPVSSLTDSIIHKLAPYRIDINSGNEFSITQAWQLFFRE